MSTWFKIIFAREGVWYSDRLCDWLWGVLALNHDGTIIPCCVYSKSSDPLIFGNMLHGTDHSKDIWNNKEFKDFRKKHITEGRKFDAVCATCQLEGLGTQSEERVLRDAVGGTILK